MRALSWAFLVIFSTLCRGQHLRQKKNVDIETKGGIYEDEIEGKEGVHRDFTYIGIQEEGEGGEVRNLQSARQEVGGTVSDIAGQILGQLPEPPNSILRPPEGQNTYYLFFVIMKE